MVLVDQFLGLVTPALIPVSESNTAEEHVQDRTDSQVSKLSVFSLERPNQLWLLDNATLSDCHAKHNAREQR
jgi:hypothetical protein